MTAPLISLSPLATKSLLKNVMPKRYMIGSILLREFAIIPVLQVTHVKDAQIAPDGCPVFNPAFDVTPAKYLTGIITDEGICYPPFEISLRKAKEAAEKRIAAVSFSVIDNEGIAPHKLRTSGTRNCKGV